MGDRHEHFSLPRSRFAAARTFKPLDDREFSAILAKSAPFAAAGKAERYQTTTNFEGTAPNPQYLG